MAYLRRTLADYDEDIYTSLTFEQQRRVLLLYEDMSDSDRLKHVISISKTQFNAPDQVVQMDVDSGSCTPKEDALHSDATTSVKKYTKFISDVRESACHRL